MTCKIIKCRVKHRIKVHPTLITTDTANIHTDLLSFARIFCIAVVTSDKDLHAANLR